MNPVAVNPALARRIWLHAERLDERAPFGAGPEATAAAIEHLGYVQIDTINVIERCHHHILYTRNPDYRRADLRSAQTIDKSVFEYWTHALAYIPARDYRFYLPAMARARRETRHGSARVSLADYRRVIRMIRDNGPITIREITDDVLVEKEHLWDSRKPSKAALQRAFWNGVLTISARSGMVKTYELTGRHFRWNAPPRPASERQILDYLIDMALRTQGIVSIDSIRHTRRNIGPALARLIGQRVRAGTLVPVTLEGAATAMHWARPQALEETPEAQSDLVHILSPFDPLVRLRARTQLFFNYMHVFEAYVPKAKRKYGYFTLPVLIGDKFAAMLDIKTDRVAGALLIQAWRWTGRASRAWRTVIEEELDRFERFQLASD